MGFDIGGSILSSSMLTPDGVILPKNFKRVTADMISSVVNQNCTIISEGNDSGGGYSISYYFNLGGCGGTESGLHAFIKNNITWSRIFCKFTMEGIASCWTFNQTGYGGISPNLASYDTSQGDIIFRWDSTNSFENTSYNVQVNACDNASTNFMRYGGVKSFSMFMRRANTSPAGFGHGRSCNGTGAGSYCTISDIYIM